LVFENTGLNEVAESVENYFGIKVEMENPALANCRFTGSFKKPDLKELLEILKLSVNLKVEQKDNHYILKGSGCP
jgi:ferric-dicitrate binding protein FerR (iron transport regulator)